MLFARYCAVVHLLHNGFAFSPFFHGLSQSTNRALRRDASLLSRDDSHVHDMYANRTRLLSLELERLRNEVAAASSNSSELTKFQSRIDLLSLELTASRQEADNFQGRVLTLQAALEDSDAKFALKFSESNGAMRKLELELDQAYSQVATLTDWQHYAESKMDALVEAEAEARRNIYEERRMHAETAKGVAAKFATERQQLQTRFEAEITEWRDKASATAVALEEVTKRALQAESRASEAERKCHDLLSEVSAKAKELSAATAAAEGAVAAEDAVAAAVAREVEVGARRVELLKSLVARARVEAREAEAREATVQVQLAKLEDKLGLVTLLLKQQQQQQQQQSQGRQSRSETSLARTEEEPLAENATEPGVASVDDSGGDSGNTAVVKNEEAEATVAALRLQVAAQTAAFQVALDRVLTAVAQVSEVHGEGEAAERDDEDEWVAAKRRRGMEGAPSAPSPELLAAQERAAGAERQVLVARAEAEAAEERCAMLESRLSQETSMLDVANERWRKVVGDLENDVAFLREQLELEQQQSGLQALQQQEIQDALEAQRHGKPRFWAKLTRFWSVSSLDASLRPPSTAQAPAAEDDATASSQTERAEASEPEAAPSSTTAEIDEAPSSSSDLGCGDSSVGTSIASGEEHHSTSSAVPSEEDAGVGDAAELRQSFDQIERYCDL